MEKSPRLSSLPPPPREGGESGGLSSLRIGEEQTLASARCPLVTTGRPDPQGPCVACRLNISYPPIVAGKQVCKHVSVFAGTLGLVEMSRPGAQGPSLSWSGLAQGQDSRIFFARAFPWGARGVCACARVFNLCAERQDSRNFLARALAFPVQGDWRRGCACKLGSDGQDSRNWLARARAWGAGGDRWRARPARAPPLAFASRPPRGGCRP